MVNKLVEKKFLSYPEKIRKKMLSLRKLIYDVAKETEGVEKLEETLKWGEPAYLTSESKSGTTIRIDWKVKNPNYLGVYFNCNTKLVSNFKIMFSDKLMFEENRAILLSTNQKIPKKELRICIAMALKYHKDKTR